jgi:hypothetical protein
VTAQPESRAARTTGELADVGAGHYFPPISPDFQKDNPRSFIELEGLQEIAAKSRPPRHAFHIGA